MLLRDRLLARMVEMHGAPDYVALAADVLGIRNAPPALARRLVEQALVVEDRREAWLRAGERICAAAPTGPGVYLLRDAAGGVLYVGKANNVRRRLRTHFAARRWRAIKPAFARAESAVWQEVGSEIEALLTEAAWIRDLRPEVNVQVSSPALATRAVPATLLRDTVLVLPAADDTQVLLLAVRVSGAVLMRYARRDGVGLLAPGSDVWRFIREAGEQGSALDPHASRTVLSDVGPLVFSWLAGRGAATTRLDPHDSASAREFTRRVRVVFDDRSLFAERIVVIRSGVRSTSKRP